MAVSALAEAVAARPSRIGRGPPDSGGRGTGACAIRRRSRRRSGPRRPDASWGVFGLSAARAPPHRGRRNEPGYTRHTAEVGAKAFGLTLEEFAAATEANFDRLFAKAAAWRAPT